MSSKSKKNVVPPTPAHASTALARSSEHPHETHDLSEKVEEVLHVPTGRNPLRFLLTVLAVIVLTAIFAIDPSTMFQATGGGGGGEAYMTWTHPRLGKVEVSGQKFQTAMRQFNDYARLFGGRPTAEDTAAYLVMTELARESGVHVTNAELRERLVEIAAQGFGDVEALKQYMRSTEGGIQGFEGTVRKHMAGQRYVQLLAYMAATPDPRQIEKIWLDGHQERAFDYVALDVDSLLEDARAEIPDDATLEAWLAARDEFQRTEFEEPERISAELVGFLFDGDNDAAGLLERYPDPGHAEETAGEETPEHDHEGELAKQYFDRVLYWRFARPIAEGETPPTDVQERYFSFDEVAETAKREAPIYMALERWRDDLRQRALAGETIDLAAEASSLGLTYRPAGEELSPEQWNAVEGFGGDSLGGRLARLADGEITPVLMIEKGGLSLARLVSRTPAYLPEFAAIREKVAEAWAKQRASELAVARLAAVRDGFQPKPEDPAATDADEAPAEPQPYASEAQFAEAVAAIGLEVQRRPHMEDSVAAMRDPDAALPGHAFIRSSGDLTALEEGEVAAPALGSDGKQAFLVRAAGARDPEAWKLTPAEYEQSQRRFEFDATTQFVRDNFAFEALAKKYAITLPQATGS